MLGRSRWSAAVDFQQTGGRKCARFRQKRPSAISDRLELLPALFPFFRRLGDDGRDSSYIGHKACAVS